MQKSQITGGRNRQGAKAALAHLGNGHNTRRAMTETGAADMGWASSITTSAVRGRDGYLGDVKVIAFQW